MLSPWNFNIHEHFSRQEENFSVTHHPIFFPSGLIFLKRKRVIVNTTGGKRNCLQAGSLTDDFAEWVTLFLLPQQQEWHGCWGLASGGESRHQLGKHKDFSANRLDGLAPGRVGKGRQGSFSRRRTKPFAIYLSLKQAGNILKLNRQLWLSFSY